MRYLIPIFLLACLAKVNSEAWTLTDPSQLFDDTDALTDDPSATYPVPLMTTSFKSVQ